MQPRQPLRAGIIGFGVSGSVFHAPTISALEGFQLAAIVSDRPDHLRLAGRRYPTARLWSDVEAFFAQVSELDVVTVSVPADLHDLYARRLIDAGVPVVVEKPIANTSTAALDLIEYAAASGAFLTCFQNRRWDGDYLTARSLIENGGLGRVTRYVSRFEAPQFDVSDGWRENPSPTLAGGVLYDLGAHLVDQALQLFGDVQEVYAETAISRPGARIDDDSFMSLLFANGVRAHLEMSKASAKPAARFHVVGTEGTYTKWGLDPQEGQLQSGVSPLDPAYGVSQDASVLTTRAGDQPVALRAGDYREFYRGVAKALRDGAPPPVDPTDSASAVRILEAARQAAASHAVVKL
jgi:predicted dehydrogenase